MPRNVRSMGWRDKHHTELPQDHGRTQESLDAETRVRAGVENPFWDKTLDDTGSPLTNQDWINIDQKRKFVSPGLGQLSDIEENRLAAKAYDEMGWPMSVMTGATKEFASWNSCGMNIRQMATVKYDSTIHKPQTEEEWEWFDIRQRQRVRIQRVTQIDRKILPS